MVDRSFIEHFESHHPGKQVRRVLAKGDTLFNQNDRVESFYFITLDRIKLIRNTEDGSPVVLHIGQRGEAIAEASLFSDYYHCLSLIHI